jgi:CubicO group peptidase (beta-lactamase class C family)
MVSNQIGELELEPGEKFGLGFSVLTSPSPTGGAGTFGWGGFFHTSFWVDPDNDLIGIFMSQLRPPEGVDVREDFRRTVYEALPDSP